MRHLTYSQQLSYPVCFLVSEVAMRADRIQEEYLTKFGVTPDDVLVLTTHQSATKKKTPVAEIKEYIEQVLVSIWEEQGTEYIVCTDSDYFKVLTKSDKAEANLGYVLDCAFGSQKVVYVPSHTAVFYAPVAVKAKIAMGMNALADHAAGTYVAPGTNIVEFEAYPKTLEEIEWWLNHILEMDKPLGIDIEAFSLKHHKAGIGTISIAWSKTEGIAFPVDYVAIEGATEAPFGYEVRNDAVRILLRSFFERLGQRAMYHNISYDVYVLIYQLYMNHLLDTGGLLRGMEVLLKNWDDTKLITYLATNSCAGNDLGLKIQAQEYAGNYAEDQIHDITKIPLDKLLKYNLVDSLSTWFTYEKHHQKMVDDDQLDVYVKYFKPAIHDIIQMQLTGMPLNMNRVAEVKKILATIMDHAVTAMRSSALIQEFEYCRLENFTNEKNAEWKKKRMTVDEMRMAAESSAAFKKQITFNPNSGPQMQELLFEKLGLPVISLTANKQPSVDRETMEALVNHATEPRVKEFLLSMLDYAAVNKILTAFIPAMEAAGLGNDGWHYLFGNFNLGGTLSGRLSSSNPNLQNLPANVFMTISDALMKLLGDSIKPFLKKGKLGLGKLIKYCFQAPPGWIFCGLDFASLEDRISALTTKDPNKLKVYTDGYDGHSLRAFSYFGESMPDIVDTVESINSIQDKYPAFRQDSKAPTFALTYQGTYITLMKNCGFSKEKAKLVEARYHELYTVSDAWVESKLDEASKQGYITGAFGLRLRTPLLEQVIRGNSKTPHEAEAEGRTAGNALGQSWCLLNSRAASEFMGKVRQSEFKEAIRPCAHIHDAQYYLVRDDIKAIHYTNQHLVEAVKWQDHPDIAHDEVKLGGELSIFYPDWSREIEIPNGASEDEIFHIIDKAMT